jgi:hypothetical protein
MNTLYAVELRIARSGENVTMSYRLAGKQWVSTPCGTQTGAVSPLFVVTSGDGGNTLQNGRFVAAIDYFQVLSGVSTLASQTIAFGSTVPTVTVGGTGTVSATASSGLAVTLTSLTAPICTVSGSTVTGVATGICTIAANQSGNGTYAAAPQVTLSFSIAANSTPPGPPTITSIKAGSGSATINFSAPDNTGGSPITSYTATCTATGQTTRTATGIASPLTVRNLTGGVVYQCSLTATNGGGFSSVASAAMSVTATAKKSSLTPILMLLLD